MKILTINKVCDGTDIKCQLDDNSILTFHCHNKDLTQEQLEQWLTRTEIQYELSRLQG